jgi:hypothetical protein
MLQVDRTEGATAAPISGVLVNGQFFAIVQLLASRDLTRSESELLTRKPTLLSRYIFLRHRQFSVLQESTCKSDIVCKKRDGPLTSWLKNSCILIVAY